MTNRKITTRSSKYCYRVNYIYSSKDSLYQETGWEKLSSKRGREDASHFLLNCQLYIEHRTVLLNCLHHREILGQGWITHALLTLKNSIRNVLSSMLKVLLLQKRPIIKTLILIAYPTPHYQNLCDFCNFHLKYDTKFSQKKQNHSGETSL